jgi:regulator of sigma E protease
MVALQYILAILGFSLIILVHEFGHFIFAKLNKIFVSEFFLGFGPKLLKFRSKSGTLFGISAIPLGGYNKILGFDRTEKIPEGKEGQVFYKKPAYSKLSVIIGGSFMNVVLTFLLVVIFFSMGTFVPSNTVDFVEEGSPAYEYGIQVEDKIIAVNEAQTQSWEELTEQIIRFPGEEVIFRVQRDGQTESINVVLGDKDGTGYLGISPKLVREQIGFFEVIKESFRTMGDLITSFVRMFGMLFSGNISFAEARPVSPIGVITIFQQSAAMGFQNFILFVALVSLLLGFTNLLPLLPLDGGHVVVLIIEAIRKRPLHKRVIEVYNGIGLVLFISLLVIGFVFDIINPINLLNMWL